MILLALLAGLAISGAYSLAAGWALMLAVGVVRAEWIPQCPTVGYWWAVVIAVLLRWALHPVQSGSSE